MKLEVSDEQLNKIVQTAVLEHLTPENRVDLISKAIENMMTEPSPNARYASNDKDKKETMIEWVMSRTLHTVLDEHLTAYWDSDEGKAKIKELVAKAIKSVDDDKVIEAMANGLSERLRRGY